MSNTMLILTDAAATGAGSSVDIREDGRTTVQVYGSTASGTGAATVDIEVGNASGIWITAGTITLSLSTTPSSDGFALDARWSMIRANVISISGTGAKVSTAITG